MTMTQTLKWKRETPPEKMYAKGDAKRFRSGPYVVQETRGIDGVKIATRVILVVNDAGWCCDTFRTIAAAKKAAEEIDDLMKCGSPSLSLACAQWYSGYHAAKAKRRAAAAARKRRT